MNIEPILKKAVRVVHSTHPYVPYDELESEAWVIAAESLETYDATKGTALTSYIYGMIDMKLRTWIRLAYQRQENMNGLRVFLEDFSFVGHTGETARTEAKADIEKILSESEGRSKDVLSLICQGYTQSEIATELGLSRQRISQILMEVRERYAS